MTIRTFTIDPVPLDARFDAPGVWHRFNTQARIVGDNVRGIKVTLTSDGTWDAAIRKATVMLTGGPTGGSLRLGFNGGLTAAFTGRNATNVQNQLRNIPAIGATGVSATGGPLPGNDVICTFTSAVFNQDQPPALSADGSALTGGTTPQAFFWIAELLDWGIEISTDGGASWLERWGNRHIALGHHPKGGAGMPALKIEGEELVDIVGVQARLFVVPTFDHTLGAIIDVSDISGEL